MFPIGYNTNLLLTEREGRTREYCPEVEEEQTERCDVSTLKNRS